MRVFIAFNPETNFNTTLEVLKQLDRSDGVLFMGVEPGKENQEFNLNTIRKIKNIHQEFPHMQIQVDGGVSDKTAPKLVNAGATILNSGSFVSGAKDSKEALDKLKKSILI